MDAIGTLSFETTGLEKNYYGYKTSQITKKSVTSLGKEITFYHANYGGYTIKIGDTVIGDSSDREPIVSAKIPEKPGGNGFVLQRLQAEDFGISYIQAKIGGVDIKVGNFNHSGTSLELNADVQLVAACSSKLEASYSDKRKFIGGRLTHLFFNVFRISGLFQFGGFNGEFNEIEEAGEHMMTIGSLHHFISFLQIGNKRYGEDDEEEFQDSQLLPQAPRFAIKKLRTTTIFSDHEDKTASLSRIEAVVQGQDLKAGYDVNPPPFHEAVQRGEAFFHEVNIDVKPLVSLSGVSTSHVVDRLFFNFHQDENT